MVTNNQNKIRKIKQAKPRPNQKAGQHALRRLRGERKVFYMFSKKTFDKIVSRAELRSNLIKLYESLGSRNMVR